MALGLNPHGSLAVSEHVVTVRNKNQITNIADDNIVQVSEPVPYHERTSIRQ